MHVVTMWVTPPLVISDEATIFDVYSISTSSSVPHCCPFFYDTMGNHWRHGSSVDQLCECFQPLTPFLTVLPLVLYHIILFTTVKWFILKDGKNHSLVNSYSRYFLVGMSKTFLVPGQRFHAEWSQMWPMVLVWCAGQILKQCFGA